MAIKQLCYLYGIIEFGSIEGEVIRHREFNRLADVKQLGYTYKGAYKTASHTRLSHSIGVAYLSKKILEKAIENTRREIKSNRGNKSKLPTESELARIKDSELVLSLAALLHDINHTPYAHTIQSHLKLKEEIIESENGFESSLENFSDCIEFDKELRRKVKCVLIKKKNDEFEFGKLFQTIIRSDFGASTIDFVQRDLYTTGHARIALFRILESFLLVKSEERINLALNLSNERTFDNNEILTTVYHLLFNRYKLCETVYFHSTNVSAEAMVGKALRHIIRHYDQQSGNGVEKMQEFLNNNKTDAHFYISLESHELSAIREIGIGLLQRNIYDTAYTFKYSETTEAIDLRGHLCDKYCGCDGYEDSFKLEGLIAEAVGVDEDDIIVHCCNKKMYAFDIDDLIVVDKQLNLSTYKLTSRDVISESFSKFFTHVKELHNSMWQFYVFVKRKHLYKKDQNLLDNINSLCTDKFKNLNSFKDFTKTPNSTLKENKSTGKRPTNVALSKQEKLEDRKFEIAFSFAGENRDYVAEILKGLRLAKHDISVFYDKDFESELANTNLVVNLLNVYRNQSKLVVVILCENYSTKKWCGLEWHAVLDLIWGKRGSDLFFIKKGKIGIDGFLPTFGYVDGEIISPSDMAEKLLDKLSKMD